MSSPAPTKALSLTLSGKVENSLVQSGYEGSEAKVPAKELDPLPVPNAKLLHSAEGLSLTTRLAFTRPFLPPNG